MLESLITPLIRWQYNNVLKREKEIGYKLVLPKSREWIPATMIFDMSPVWKRFGLNALGVNYFTIGAVKNGMSMRFDPTSPYYQAWLGGYIVRFPEERTWTIDEHFELGVADQKNWLQLYGVKNPEVYVDRSSVKYRGLTKISGYKAKVYEGNIWSNTDVGETKPNALKRLLMDGGAQFFNTMNPKLNVKGAEMIPVWKGDVEPLESYQKILLKGYIIIVPINKNTTAMLYGNSCEIQAKAIHADYFAKIATSLRRTLEKITITSAS